MKKTENFSLVFWIFFKIKEIIEFFVLISLVFLEAAPTCMLYV